MKTLVFALILVALLVVFLLRKPVGPLSLQTSGVQMFHVLNPVEVETLRNLDNKTLKETLQTNPRILQVIAENVGPGYVFQDYVFIFKKSSIHTCHRDANGDLFNKGQRHPSYTVIVFLEGSDTSCLEVVPGSHDGRPLNFGGTTGVPCQAGDMILFDANVVHAGVIGPDRLRVQMKVTHEEDRETIGYYENYNKVSQRDNIVPELFKGLQQGFTCATPFLADMFQDEVKQSYTDKVSEHQKVYSKLFYGSEDFYKLPDAF